jgi:Tfp pilus assembly protein PilV
MKKHCHDRRHSQVNAFCGFALVETIIALLILAIALLAMAFVPIMSTKLALQTVHRERAMTLAYSGLDFLESIKFDSAVTSTDTVSGDFRVTYTKPKYSAASNDYKAIVTVKWGGVTGGSELILERSLSKFSQLTRED